MLKRLSRLIPWKSLARPWQDIDWWLLLAVIGVTVFGGLVIRSTELNLEGGVRTDWWQHWLMGGIGLVLAMGLARMRYELLLQWRWIIYGITCLSLVAVIGLGTTALGAQRWITIGSFNIQPSEFAKLGAVITVAAMLQERTASTLEMVLKTLVVVAVPWALVFIQPDLGTSLVFGAITLAMLYWGNAKPAWLLLLASPLISAIAFNQGMTPWVIGGLGLWCLGIGWVGLSSLPWGWRGGLGAAGVNVICGELGIFAWQHVLKDYQKQRVYQFLNPENDPLGAGYHVIQSRIAIGSGQLLGKGMTQGTQTQLNFIPEQHTDFIFSAIGEELGFIGCFVLLLVFWFICLRLVIIAQNAKDNFGSLLAIGMFGMLVFQVFVNISMTIGLAPVTGIPLPWISYGRSAMLTNYLAIGIVQSVANYRRQNVGLWRDR